MSREEGLLEVLTHRVGANYISDLRKDEFRNSLIGAIESIDSTAYAVGEWSDVLDYLTGMKTQISNPEEGKKTLLRAL
ncbi:hypothetical protein GCM10008910_16740 [Faecalicatena orotica]|uniref:Uncharacterized protein n=1 Tax=Faecalicatena orotica TaxID=1544 RepID=A0A2Y9B7Q5_9FIRM|nr:hypothetical protein [Faecalicatena orotica]PWJ31717.1 hypothetical protein A8806_1011 [Faecalicatena orotica]SSA53537.1 hypothetical protein SAMN05216536_1011 [Faecalicatena orotica]